jgi:hypothetical protein
MHTGASVKLVYLLITLFFIQNVSAFTEQEFCQELVKKNDKEDEKIPLKTIIKVLFYPRTIVQPQQNNEIHAEENEKSDNGSKIIYIHLPELEPDILKIKKLKVSAKKIARMKLFKKLQKIKTHDACLDLIDQNQIDYQTIRNHLVLAISIDEELQKNKEKNARKDLLKRLKAFERKGWEIISSKNIIEFYKSIELKSPKEILFIGHSDQFGNLYDSEKNKFPKKSFHHLAKGLNHFILYSCHAEKVINNYELKTAFADKTLSYPKIKKEYSTLFEDNTPLSSIRSMINLPSKVAASQTKIKECSLSLNARTETSGYLISFNDSIIGVIHNEYEKEIFFDCSILKEKNVIRVFSPASLPKNSPELTEINVKSKNETIPLKIKEYISQTTQNHILTIGTNGGLP